MKQVNSKDFFDALRPAEDLVELKTLPKALHQDIEGFMFGRTVVMRNGGPAFFPVDYNDWLAKVQTEGLDYDIQVIE